MKRYIVVIFFMFFGFNFSVYASTYYGSYKFVGYDEMLLNDEVKKEEVKLYNTFSLEYKDLGYFEENDEYTIDKSDFIDKELFTENYNPSSEELIKVGVETEQLDNLTFESVNLATRIFEIIVYYKDEAIDYTLSCDDVIESYKIKDGRFDTYSIFLKEKSYLKLIFNKKYNISDIKVLVVTGKNMNNLYLNLLVSNKKYLIKMSEYNDHIFEFDSNDGLVKLYKNNVRFYKHYQEIYKVEDIYVVDGNNLILDDFKYINKYYKRDKLVLSDNSVIDDTYKNASDFVEYSSDEVKVIDNIDYDKPGEYDCIYILNDIEVNKKIKVLEIADVVKEDNSVTPVKDDVIVTKVHKQPGDFYYSKIDKSQDSYLDKTMKTTTSLVLESFDNKVDKKKNSIIEKIIILIFILFEVLFFIIKRKRKKRIVESV